MNVCFPLQAVLVDQSGPVTVVGEPGAAVDAGRVRPDIPPAVTPIRAGGPSRSRSSSRPTTPKGPGEHCVPAHVRRGLLYLVVCSFESP